VVKIIIGVEGGLGSGKTILIVRYLYKDDKKGIPVYANFHLKNIRHKLLDVMEILQMDKSKSDINNMSLAIDEITVFMDCRTSITKMNRLISYFILQTRKRNVTLYYTTQHFGMVDKRLINHTDIRIIAEKIPKYKKSLQGDIISDGYYNNYRKYTIYDLRDLKNFKWKSFKLKISDYYEYYDTNEVILPPIK